MLGFLEAHRSRGVPAGDIKKFLNDLVTNCALSSQEALPEQVIGHFGLGCGRLIERIDNNVGIEKESIAHSFRRAYKADASEPCGEDASSGRRIPPLCLPVG